MDRDQLKRFVDMANANRSLMDGTTRPVQKIIKAHDVVLGIWQDRSSCSGRGHVIKGRRVKGDGREWRSGT